MGLQGLLYAGTEAGMYIFFNDGESWQPFQLNLPIVPITDLVCGTTTWSWPPQAAACGLWTTHGTTPTGHCQGKEFPLQAPRHSPYGRGYNKGSPTAGTNHPDGVMVYYNLEDPEDKDIRLSFEPSERYHQDLQHQSEER